MGRTWRLEGEGETLKKEGEWAIKLKQFGQGNARDLIGGEYTDSDSDKLI